MFGSLFKKKPEISNEENQKNDIINFRNFVLVGGLLILGSIITSAVFLVGAGILLRVEPD